MRGEPLGDLQHRRATLADVGTGVVIPELKQFAALLLAQSQGTTGHRRLPHGGGCMADGTEYTRFTDFESRNSLEIVRGVMSAESGGWLGLRQPPDRHTHATTVRNEGEGVSAERDLQRRRASGGRTTHAGKVRAAERRRTDEASRGSRGRRPIATTARRVAWVGGRGGVPTGGARPRAGAVGRAVVPRPDRPRARAGEPGIPVPDPRRSDHAQRAVL